MSNNIDTDTENKTVWLSDIDPASAFLKLQPVAVTLDAGTPDAESSGPLHQFLTGMCKLASKDVENPMKAGEFMSLMAGILAKKLRSPELEIPGNLEIPAHLLTLLPRDFLLPAPSSTLDLDKSSKKKASSSSSSLSVTLGHRDEAGGDGEADLENDVVDDDASDDGSRGGEFPYMGHTPHPSSPTAARSPAFGGVGHSASDLRGSNWLIAQVLRDARKDVNGQIPLTEIRPVEQHLAFNLFDITHIGAAQATWLYLTPTERLALHDNLRGANFLGTNPYATVRKSSFANICPSALIGAHNRINEYLSATAPLQDGTRGLAEGAVIPNSRNEKREKSDLLKQVAGLPAVDLFGKESAPSPLSSSNTRSNMARVGMEETTATMACLAFVQTALDKGFNLAPNGNPNAPKDVALVDNDVESNNIHFTAVHVLDRLQKMLAKQYYGHLSDFVHSEVGDAGASLTSGGRAPLAASPAILGAVTNTEAVAKFTSTLTKLNTPSAPAQSKTQQQKKGGKKGGGKKGNSTNNNNKNNQGQAKAGNAGGGDTKGGKSQGEAAPKEGTTQPKGSGNSFSGRGSDQ